MTPFTESIVEEAALAWLTDLGHAVPYGPEIAAGELGAERNDADFRDVGLETRLQNAPAGLNPGLPAEAPEDAFRKLMRADPPSVIERDHAIHRMLVAARRSHD